MVNPESAARADGGLTRRSVLLGAAAAVLPLAGGAAEAALAQPATAPPAGRPWKIAFEEHFITPTADLMPTGLDATTMPAVYHGLLEVGEGRIALMDQAGIAYAILSLNSPGLQAETDGAISADKARRINAELKAITAHHPARLGGFAALPTQDPRASADELERCVREYGFHGALINSFANAPGSQAVYLDDPRYDVLWERAVALGVPIYLHPRNPLPSQSLMFDGRPELIGAMWGFLVECSTHALRMICGGVFDRFPTLTIGLGHLGEALPAYAWRVSAVYATRPSKTALQHDIPTYLRRNFVYTTSGFFDTAAVRNVIGVVGIDRICFSTDHPWMNMVDGSRWFDRATFTPAEKLQIGRGNAAKLFNLPA
jgi:2,3-dihydroxybenzoate decarboxylase